MSNTYDKQANFLRTLKAIQRGANTASELREVVGSSCCAFNKLRKEGLVELEGRFYKLTKQGLMFLSEGVKHDTRTSSIKIY